LPIVAGWLAEAMALPLLGIPSRAFKIMFEDSEAAPDAISKVFDALQQDVAWQIAEDLSYKRQLKVLPISTWTERRRRHNYTYEALPQALQNIGSHDSLVHCEFIPGRTYDPEKIFDEFAEGSWQEYRRKYHAPYLIEIPRNRPPWYR